MKGRNQTRPIAVLWSLECLSFVSAFPYSCNASLFELAFGTQEGLGGWNLFPSNQERRLCPGGPHFGPAQAEAFLLPRLVS